MMGYDLNEVELDEEYELPPATKGQASWEGGLGDTGYDDSRPGTAASILDDVAEVVERHCFPAPRLNPTLHCQEHFEALQQDLLEARPLTHDISPKELR